VAARNAGTLETLARHLAEALRPVEGLLQADNVIAAFGELGVVFPPELLQPAFVAAIGAASAAAGGLGPRIDALVAAIEAGDDVGVVTSGLAVLQQAKATIDSFTQVGAQLAALGGALPGLSPAEVASFAWYTPFESEW